METTAATAPKAILIEANNAFRDISQLVALTRITEMGLQNLQERTSTTKAFSHSAVIPEQTRTGVSSFKLENPEPAPFSRRSKQPVVTLSFCAKQVKSPLASLSPKSPYLASRN